MNQQSFQYEFIKLSGMALNEYPDEIIGLFHSVRGSSQWSKDRIEATDGSFKDLSFLARYEDRIMAVLFAYIENGLNPILFNSRHIFLRRLVVQKEYQHQGIAKKLMIQLWNEAQKKKFDGIGYFGWQTGAKTPGIAFFNRLGFEKSGEICSGTNTDSIYWMDKNKFGSIILRHLPDV